jgi:hypothetical protein
MTRTSVAVCGFLILAVTAPLRAGHCPVDRITIKGPSLAAPIEITEPKVAVFQVWAGRGTFVNGVEQTKGFIIDWPKGVAAWRPEGLQHYEVSFYAQSEGPVYVVSYDFDPATKQGFVYLPGKGDSSYACNVRSILRHREGNWLLATKSWEDFVRPLIAKARAAGQ